MDIEISSTLDELKTKIWDYGNCFARVTVHPHGVISSFGMPTLYGNGSGRTLDLPTNSSAKVNHFVSPHVARVCKGEITASFNEFVASRSSRELEQMLREAQPTVYVD